MADLVADHRGQLVVVADDGEKAGVHPHPPTGEDEGVGVAVVEDDVLPAAVGQAGGGDDARADLMHADVGDRISGDALGGDGLLPGGGGRTGQGIVANQQHLIAPERLVVGAGAEGGAGGGGADRGEETGLQGHQRRPGPRRSSGANLHQIL